VGSLCFLLFPSSFPPLFPCLFPPPCPEVSHFIILSAYYHRNRLFLQSFFFFSQGAGFPRGNIPPPPPPPPPRSPCVFPFSASSPPYGVTLLFLDILFIPEHRHFTHRSSRFSVSLVPYRDPPFDSSVKVPSSAEAAHPLSFFFFSSLFFLPAG